MDSLLSLFVAIYDFAQNFDLANSYNLGVGEGCRLLLAHNAYFHPSLIVKCPEKAQLLEKNPRYLPVNMRKRS
jgi:hypothetical protein